MNKPELRIVYHCLCRGIWKEIVAEHMKLVRSREVHCTIVGSEEDKNEFLAICAHFQVRCQLKRFSDPTVYEHEALKVIELIALKELKNYTLYFHTKGASDNSEVNTYWRKHMNETLLGNLDEVFAELVTSEKDASGCLFVSMKKDPELRGINSYFFAGNFWIASNRYLSQLPNYEDLRIEFDNDRHLAERYIGWNHPSVLFLDQDEELDTGKKNNVYEKIFGLIPNSQT